MATVADFVLQASEYLEPNREGGDLYHSVARLSRSLNLSPAIDIYLLSLPPGTRTIPVAHSHHDTFIYVLSGLGKVWYHGETYEMGANDCVGFRGGTGLTYAFLNEDELDPDGNDPCPLDILVFSEAGGKDTTYHPLGPPREKDDPWKDPPLNQMGLHDGRPLRPRRGSTDPVLDVLASPSLNPPVNAYWPPEIFHSLVMSIPNGEAPPDGHEIGHLSVLSALSTRLGVSQIVLPPGSRSSSPYAHSKEDEFYYIVEGQGRLWIDGDSTDVAAGQCIGFSAGTGIAHCFLNDSRSKDDLMLLMFCQDFDDDQLIYAFGGANERQKVIDAERTWWDAAPKRQFGSHKPLPLP